jgi:hypothetical protein
MSRPGQLCIVMSCVNQSDQGTFIGDLCLPCHRYITTGEGVHSQAYRNSMLWCLERAARECDHAAKEARILESSPSSHPHAKHHGDMARSLAGRIRDLLTSALPGRPEDPRSIR